ncbi:DUF4253 domain-containing protein [Streptomyces bambusae]|uniref:DUF4253 domain-containing protein n=1 Tax=Streptomyces bambusae TaxID=1550616 RepID=UPI001CFE05C0|nr:DUF4253 domain-containing protein [Streptomyces bambusae]MCB5167849.1 DUF4253 domain-containing protein [Streptomyces bambusae]
MTMSATPSFPLSVLPPGVLAGPVRRRTVWVGDVPAAPDDWVRLRDLGRPHGLLPLLLADDGPWGPGWWTREHVFRPERMSDPDDHHAEVVLRTCWAGVVPDEEEDEDPEGEGIEVIAPFGRTWAGLAEPGPAAGVDPERTAAETAAVLIGAGGRGRPRPALVPARRSADLPAAAGWTGPTNHTNDTAVLSAVLRSWEDRYGARVVALGFDHLLASVASPPVTSAAALAVAAEHFAFCPDNVWQGAGSIREYARELRGAHTWTFWWD